MIMSKPKVSVVIPAYNGMKYLPDTLQSVWCQSFTDFEVILVDDGSSDNIKQWASQIKDSRFKFISQNNQGLSAARNTGINHSQGEYIAFLDSDDLWVPTKLETHVLCLDSNPEVGLVCSWTAMMNAQGQPTGRLLKPLADGNVYSQLLVKNIIDCPSVVVRRTCFDKVGLFNSKVRYVEDWEMWIRMATVCEFAVIKEPLVYYRQHPNNMSKNWQQMQLGFNQVISGAFESAPKELQHLKKLSYSHANLVLAWKALQSTDKDLQLAANFRASALRYNPKQILSHEFWRLSIAIALMRYFGLQGYNRFLEFVYTFRKRLSHSLPL
ncbi:putative glycosyl transferase [Calothrix sp. NIES-4071]|nr:putative glycosyl transferase [Calothrix sp. NIES-4071]BAZ56374.1 putative glycosyl transferase [Calothrix sp. NIES-4105]